MTIVIVDEEQVKRWGAAKPSSDYAEEPKVVQIGDSFYITVPYGAGQKRLMLTRKQFADILLKMQRTVVNPDTHKVNGITVPQKGAGGGVRLPD
jgi:hypothetical protein